MGVLALIGLGSNLGDRKALLDGAVAALARTDGIVVRAVSRYHETAAVGGPAGQGPFLNGAAALETSLSPFALHSALARIELEAGRTREVRWGERTLDLDLLLFGDEIHDTPALTVPHPRMAVRRFVLAPLAEIVPDAIDPLTNRSVADLLANLDRRPSYIAIAESAKIDEWSPFPKLLSSLRGFGLDDLPTELWDKYSEGIVDDDSDDWENDPIRNEVIKRFERMRFEQKARELDRERWLAESWGTGWMTSNYWIGDSLARLWEIPDGFHTQKEFESAGLIWDGSELDLIQPTFIVSAYREYDDYLLETPIDADFPAWYPGPRAPKLWLHDLPDFKAEWGSIFRGASDIPEEERVTYDISSCISAHIHRVKEYIAKNEDPIVAEILAACHASRAGSPEP